PFYAPPREFACTGQGHSLGRLEERRLLPGRGWELAWLGAPGVVLFLPVQGTGKIRLPAGRVMRLGFAAKNNHPYRSIGAELIARRVMDRHQVSAQRIKNWVRAHPREGAELLKHNPSFVFFRKLPELGPDEGPIGAMGV